MLDLVTVGASTRLEVHLAEPGGYERSPRLRVVAEQYREAMPVRILDVGDVLDPEKERARLTKLKDKLAKQIGGSEKKLGNERFLAKAPEQVINQAKAKLADLQNQLALVEENLAQLG